MTTIAYKAGIMACDSCWTIGDQQVTALTKIVRLPSGGLLGQAGDNDAREMIDFLGKIKSAKGLPYRKALLELRCEFAGILVLPTGQVFKITCREDPLDYKDEVGFTPITRKYAACGSGNEYAIGAMAAGLCARDAVRIAAEHDINTRGPIHVMRLKP
jgi:hypothetical protein